MDLKFNGRLTRSRASKYGINVGTVFLESTKRKCNISSNSTQLPPAKRKKVVDALKIWPNDDTMNIVDTKPVSTVAKKFTKPLATFQPSSDRIIMFEAVPTVIAPVVKVVFRPSEIVWAKIKGFVAWPARIKSFPSSNMVIVSWLNDYRVTKIYRTQMFKFLLFFDTFSKRFNDTVGLETAAKEGLILFGQNLYAGNTQ